MDEPPAGEGRVEFLDALRGVAILGILPVNAAFFAYPAALADEPTYPAGSGAAGAAAVHGVAFLFEGKFITLFALLFGAGMAVLRARTAERGARWGPLVVRRLAVLWLLGCAHAVLVWFGDIVAYYALFGLALCWAPGRSPAALRAWGAALLALPVLPRLLALGAALAGGEWVADLLGGALVPELPDGRIAAPDPGSGAGALEQLLRFDPDQEIAVYRGGTFGQVTALRAATWALGAAGTVPLWGPRIAGLFLLGMAWVRGGWFLAPASEEGRRRFGSLLRWGLAAGVPLSAASVLLHVLAPRDLAAGLGAELAQYLGSLGLAAAYAAVVARACAAHPGAPWIRAAAAVGRTAFSNYLLQSALMTILFYGTTVFLGAGLGLFAGVGRWTLLGLAAGLAALQVAASVLWLRRFRAGPVEWAWRAATYLRAPPFRSRDGGRRPGLSEPRGDL